MGKVFSNVRANLKKRVNKNNFIILIKMPCSACGGTGKQTCVKCGGKGTYYDDVCGACGGDGYFTCPRCNGCG